MWSIRLLHIKATSFLPTPAECPWQTTSYKMAAIFNPETKMLNRGVIDIVAPSPRNNNPKTSAFSS